MEITRALLEEYHCGRCTADQKRAVEDWLKGQVMETDFPVGMGDGKILEDTIWNSMSENLGFIEKDKSDSRLGQFPESRHLNLGIRSWFINIAASFLIVAALGYALWFLTNQRFTDKVASPAVTKTPAREYVTISTRAGERKQYTLPDGSQVTLNAESEVRYPALFLLTDTLRPVYLKGEAFFIVAKDAERPFVVHTKRSLTRVLGTRFNLKAYERDESVMLVVQEGRVRFSDAANERHLILTANQRGTLDHGGLLENDNVYADRYFVWKENKLVFENRSLSAIAADLEHWYGVKVKIENSQSKYNHYTGSFKDKPIQEVLETMGYAVGFKYTVRNKVIVIY